MFMIGFVNVKFLIRKSELIFQKSQADVNNIHGYSVWSNFISRFSPKSKITYFSNKYLKERNQAAVRIKKRHTLF